MHRLYSEFSHFLLHTLTCLLGLIKLYAFIDIIIGREIDFVLYLLSCNFPNLCTYNNYYYIILEKILTNLGMRGCLLFARTQTQR